MCEQARHINKTPQKYTRNMIVPLTHRKIAEIRRHIFSQKVQITKRREVVGRFAVQSLRMLSYPDDPRPKERFTIFRTFR